MRRMRRKGAIERRPDDSGRHTWGDRFVPRISRRTVDSPLQVKGEEVVDAAPRIEQNMRAREIVEFTRVHHVGKQIALAFS
jgi:hypothetical protein